MFRDIDAATPPGLAPEVARAVAAAGDLMDDDPERATRLLEWAKSVAPRSGAVREALGILGYQQGDYERAARELASYRRLSGRQDQNHLLADSLRATGRADRVRELVHEMGPEVHEERRVEGWLVYAGVVADRDDPVRAQQLLERLELSTGVEAQHLRLWYATAEFAERAGNRERAAELLEAVVTVEPDFLDAAEWLARLQGLDGASADER